jgi:hypothetical protein
LQTSPRIRKETSSVSPVFSAMTVYATFMSLLNAQYALGNRLRQSHFLRLTCTPLLLPGGGALALIPVSDLFHFVYRYSTEWVFPFRYNSLGRSLPIFINCSQRSHFKYRFDLQSMPNLRVHLFCFRSFIIRTSRHLTTTNRFVEVATSPDFPLSPGFK